MKTARILAHASLALTCLTVGVAHADPGYFNYRHQFLDESRLHSDRILLGIVLDNGLGLEGELKWKTGGSRQDVAFDNTVGSGHEFTVDYAYKLSPKWTLTPVAVLDSDENATAYKAGLKLSYRVNDQLSVSGRYRYEVRKLERSQLDPEVPDRAKQDQHTHRYDTYVGYAPGGRWSYEYNLTYYNSDYVRYDYKKHDYEQNLAFRYKWNQNWRPFFEVGDTKVNSTEDKRQARWRVGIHYVFD